MKFAKISILCLCLVGSTPQGLLAQNPQAAAAPDKAKPAADVNKAKSAAIDKTDPNVVLAYRGDAVLTQAAIDGAFSRLPEKDRLMFIRDGNKVDRLVKSLLEVETVALDAEKSGFANDPVVQQRVRLAAREELAKAWLEEQVKLAPPADYRAMAYEDYLAHPEHYATEATVDVSHILIGTKHRTLDEALALAKDLKARLTADPSQFDALVVKYSDDPSKKTNAGKFLNVKHGQMVKPFEAAAFALTTPGQISDPVETEFGYHLIRLDRRHKSELPPFDEIRAQAEAQMKEKRAKSYREAFLQKLLMQEPIVFPKGSVEVMARRYFGENLEKAPKFNEDNAH